ncbi:MAG: toxin [Patescibacteria group bacterium]
MDFDYNPDKNKWLKKNRGIGFEEIIDAITDGKVLKDTKNPNLKKYSNQRILIVKIDNYAYAVPYVKDKVRKVIFLKTCWPSREFTKKYIKNEK